MTTTLNVDTDHVQAEFSVTPTKLVLFSSKWDLDILMVALTFARERPGEKGTKLGVL
jgi:hypothetical protein